MLVYPVRVCPRIRRSICGSLQTRTWTDNNGNKRYITEVVADEAYTTDSNTDFSVQLSKIKESGAELLFLPNYYSDNALILQQAADAGLDITVFGVDGMDGILDVENFDTKLAEGVMLLTPFAADATDDATVSFVTKYEEEYKETPIQFAADAYDAIYIIKAAMEKAGVTPDMSVDEMGTALSEAMTTITVDGLTGAGMTWDASGAVNKAPKAVVIKDGAYAGL